jgi:hypothetical protein
MIMIEGTGYIHPSISYNRRADVTLRLPHNAKDNVDKTLSVDIATTNALTLRELGLCPRAVIIASVESNELRHDKIEKVLCAHNC